jgi:hypothetical protein
MSKKEKKWKGVLRSRGEGETICDRFAVKKLRESGVFGKTGNAAGKARGRLERGALFQRVRVRR